MTQPAAVWLYAELVPRGAVRVEQAAAISRALALTHAGEVPAELVTAVLVDAEALVDELCLAPTAG